MVEVLRSVCVCVSLDDWKSVLKEIMYYIVPNYYKG